jgi:hypothetical protein
MVQLAAGVLQAGFDVFGLKVRQLGQNFLRGQAMGQEIKDIDHANAHAADARASAALLSAHPTENRAETGGAAGDGPKANGDRNTDKLGS